MKVRKNALDLKGLGMEYEWRSERERQHAHDFVLQNSPHLNRWRNKYDVACEEHDEARRVWCLTHRRTRFSLDMQGIQEFDDWF
jgi:hypothetical protein